MRRQPGMFRRALVLCAAAGIGITIFPQRAPATIAEQRARLPPPAECTDPVAGVWKSHQHDPTWGDWYIFTLNIQRVAGDDHALTGTIQAHSWSGGPDDEEPPACRPGLSHWTVMMTATGTHQDDHRIHFGGTSWSPENAFCGAAPGPGQYNLDQFNGQIDPALQEFQSVNNDGGRAVNVPTVFRRVSCHEAPPAPHVNPVPPPFFPKRSGCSLF
ncbi:MAG: hypothetical protein AAGF12_15975 [Myxococcota bacterium]